jgi:Ig-like domain from next to BRCA1 gene
MQKKIVIIPLMALVLAFAGCNLPQVSPTPNGASVAFTQSAQTVEARLTELAAASTPAATFAPTQIQVATDTPAQAITSTPVLATAKPSTPTPLCDVGAFVADVTVPDGTKFNPNTPFVKTWRLKNAGTCTWTTSYAAVFDSGNQMGALPAVNLTQNVPPGSTVDISVNMTAPATNGSYQSNWKLRNASGVIFGLGSTASKTFYASIEVGNTNPATIYNFVDNYCSAQWSSGAGVLPCPGTSSDVNGYVLKQDTPQLETGGAENESAIITQPQMVDNGYIAGRYPTFNVNAGDRFRGVLGCLYGASACNVQFLLNYVANGGAEQTFASWNQAYDGNIEKIDLDLSSLAGKSVIFILRVNAKGSAAQDAAFWLQPRIVR